MKRPTEETNEIITKIENVHLVYNKTLNPAAIKIWMEQLANYDKDEILRAFDDHVAGKSITESGNHSRYAPKPVHILEHIRSRRDRKKSFQKYKEESQEKPCDPTIWKAWYLFTNMKLDGQFSLFKDRHPEINLTNEQVLKIVNREAAKYNRPDSIPDEYKLKEYWEDLAA